jgi:hypothetical protein
MGAEQPLLAISARKALGFFAACSGDTLVPLMLPAIPQLIHINEHSLEWCNYPKRR